MEPTHDPRVPKPGANSLAAKGTSDTQSADLDSATNLPRPDSAPAPDSTTDETIAESQQSPEASVDPTAAETQPDSFGVSDPGASNTSNDEPLL